MESKNLIDEAQLAELEAKLKETKNQLEKMVRDYPLTSIAVAVGIGYVLARILNKDRR